MNASEIARLLEEVQRRWRNAKLELGEADTWAEDLAAFTFEECAAEVRAYALAGHQFAPTSGQIVAALAVREQGQPPSFDDMQRWLSRHCRLLTYGEANTPQHTAETIERLAAAGAHEALLRFVAAHGVYAVRMMPDPAHHPLDPNQLADRRDRARDYQQRVIPDWQADPRPGLALERAHRAALASPRGSGLRRLDPLTAASVSPAGAPPVLAPGSAE